MTTDIVVIAGVQWECDPPYCKGSQWSDRHTLQWADELLGCLFPGLCREVRLWQDPKGEESPPARSCQNCAVSRYVRKWLNTHWALSHEDCDCSREMFQLNIWYNYCVSWLSWYCKTKSAGLIGPGFSSVNRNEERTWSSSTHDSAKCDQSL